MAQRSYSNDRYRKGAKVGSTRKSAAKAKPVRKQGTVEVHASSKSSKPTQEKDWAGLPTSPQIKMWRRVWWVLLLGGLALIGIGYGVPELRVNEDVQRVIAIVVLGCSLAALFIDIFVIRKLRKELLATQPKGKKRTPPADESGAGS